MIQIASVNGYDIFEVIKGDSRCIHNMFSSSHANIDSETTTSHDWEAWVATFMPDWFKYIFEPGLKVIESDKEEAYLSRYPYEDEISSWGISTMVVHRLPKPRTRVRFPSAARK